MKVSVTHISTGYTVIHENVAKIIEKANRFELIDYQQYKGPITSTSYHKSLFTFSVIDDPHHA